MQYLCHGQNIQQQEGDGQNHRSKQHTEAWRDPYHLKVAEFVAGLDVPKETADGEDPPGVTKEGFIGAGVVEEVACAAEVEPLNQLSMQYTLVVMCVLTLATISSTQYGCARITVVM